MDVGQFELVEHVLARVALGLYEVLLRKCVNVICLGGRNQPMRGEGADRGCDRLAAAELDPVYGGPALPEALRVEDGQIKLARHGVECGTRITRQLQHDFVRDQAGLARGRKIEISAFTDV